MHEASETTNRSIVVKKLGNANREKSQVSSIREAIEEVKESENFLTTKIVLDGEIVFTSDRHAIEEWEKEWKRQKRTLSVDKTAHDCPDNRDYCYEDSLCADCKMRRAREGIANEQ